MDPPFLPAVASFCRSLHLGGLISHVATSCVGLHRGCNHQPGLIVRLSRTTFPPNKQFFSAGIIQVPAFIFVGYLMFLLPSTLTCPFLPHPYWPHPPLMKFINTRHVFRYWSCQLVFNKILYSLIKPTRLRSSSCALRRFVMCNNKKKKLKVLTHGIVFFVILLTDSGSLIQRLSLLHLITLLWLPSLLATSIQLLPPTPMKTASVTLFICGNESWRKTSSSKEGVRYKWDVSLDSCNGLYYYISA